MKTKRSAANPATNDRTDGRVASDEWAGDKKTFLQTQAGGENVHNLHKRG